MTPAPRLLLAVALGGATGAVARAALGALAPDDGGFPWTTFAINVVGSGLLAALPLLAAARRSEVVRAGLGPGLLGGFTTLSAASEQTRGLLAGGEPALAATYVVATLAAALAAVLLVATVLGPAGRERA